MFQLLTSNIPMMLEMHICTYFNPHLTWRQQLQPVMGGEEVEKLDMKLKEMNVPNLDSLHVFYNSVFGDPPNKLQARFSTLIRDIGTWPSVGYDVVHASICIIFLQDDCEYVLLSLLLLFSPDMHGLVEKRRVEDIQTKFAILLEKYLNRK